MTPDNQNAQSQNADASLQQGVPFEQLFDLIPTGIAVWRLDQPDDPTSLRLVAANAASAAQLGIDLRLLIGQRMLEVFPTTPRKQLDLYAQVVNAGQAQNLGEVSFDDGNGGAVIYEMHLIPLRDRHLCVIHTDVTERKRAEEALRQSMQLEETLRAQNAALAELSTPLIPISDEVTVMPLIGAVDSRRAQQVVETLLQGIAESRARVAILDITGVPVVDTQVANALIRAAQSVKLLGAQVILTGIRPEVAQTLVGLGADLSAITTRSSLQSGIAFATQGH